MGSMCCQLEGLRAEQNHQFRLIQRTRDLGHPTDCGVVTRKMASSTALWCRFLTGSEHARELPWRRRSCMQTRCCCCHMQSMESRDMQFSATAKLDWIEIVFDDHGLEHERAI